MFVAVEAFKRVKSTTLSEHQAKVLSSLFNKLPADDRFAHFVEQFRVTTRYVDLLSLALGPQSETPARSSSHTVSASRRAERLVATDSYETGRRSR